MRTYDIKSNYSSLPLAGQKREKPLFLAYALCKSFIQSKSVDQTFKFLGNDLALCAVMHLSLFALENSLSTTKGRRAHNCTLDPMRRTRRHKPRANNHGRWGNSLRSCNIQIFEIKKNHFVNFKVVESQNAIGTYKYLYRVTSYLVSSCCITEPPQPITNWFFFKSKQKKPNNQIESHASTTHVVSWVTMNWMV